MNKEMVEYIKEIMEKKRVITNNIQESNELLRSLERKLDDTRKCRRFESVGMASICTGLNTVEEFDLDDFIKELKEVREGLVEKGSERLTISIEAVASWNDPEHFVEVSVTGSRYTESEEEHLERVKKLEEDIMKLKEKIESLHDELTKITEETGI
jgi:uncharacterized protein YqgV (UPF0045/DUF77 family)